MDRRGYFPAIVQQAGHFQLVAVTIIHPESGQVSLPRAIHGLGQHHGEFGNPLAMTTRVGRFFIDCAVDHADEGLEQLLQLQNKLAIGDSDRSLGGQRLGQALVGEGKRHDRAVSLVFAIDELQDTDDLPLVILHRHCQEGLGPVSGLLVDVARAGEIEALLDIGVGNIHRFPVQSGVSRNHGVIWLPFAVGEVNGVEGNFRSVDASHRNAQCAVANDCKSKAIAPLEEVEGAAVSPGNCLRGHENLL